MGIRSIQFLALGALTAAATLVAAQTTSLRAANECRLTVATDDASAMEFAAMFTSNNDADSNVFADSPLFIYAANDIAVESEGVMLLDVSDVTNCPRHKNII
jgi:hypothetical protein